MNLHEENKALNMVFENMKIYSKDKSKILLYEAYHLERFIECIKKKKESFTI